MIGVIIVGLIIFLAHNAIDYLYSIRDCKCRQISLVLL